MVAWLIPIAEAAVFGLAAGFTTYASTHDPSAAIAAFGSAFVGKMAPVQLLKKS